MDKKFDVKGERKTSGLRKMRVDCRTSLTSPLLAGERGKHQEDEPYLALEDIELSETGKKADE
jgi:hypothetical protein